VETQVTFGPCGQWSPWGGSDHSRNLRSPGCNGNEKTIGSQNSQTGACGRNLRKNGAPLASVQATAVDTRGNGRKLTVEFYGPTSWQQGWPPTQFLTVSPHARRCGADSAAVRRARILRSDRPDSTGEIGPDSGTHKLRLISLPLPVSAGFHEFQQEQVHLIASQPAI